MAAMNFGIAAPVGDPGPGSQERSRFALFSDLNHFCSN